MCSVHLMMIIRLPGVLFCCLFVSVVMCEWMCVMRISDQ